MVRSSRVLLAALVVGTLVGVETPTAASALPSLLRGPATVGAGGWLSFGNGPTNQRTNANPTVGPAQAKSLKELWNSFTTAGGVELTTSAVVTNGTVYAGCEDAVCAVNARTGALIWTFATVGQVYASPALSDGVIYIGDEGAGGGGGSSTMYALNATTGSELWHTSVPGTTYASANVVDGVVYSGDDTGGKIGGGLDAFNAASGAGGLKSLVGRGGDDSTPAIANGLAYIYASGRLYAFNATGGKQVWVRALGSGIGGSPTVANGLVFVGGSSVVAAFDASTGASRWSISLPGGLMSTAFANNILYVGDVAGGTVYAFNASTGHQLWQTAIKGTVVSSPSVANGVVYFGSHETFRNSHPQNYLNAADASTGELLWQHAIPGDTLSFFASPAVANGIIYYGSYAFGL